MACMRIGDELAASEFAQRPGVLEASMADQGLDFGDGLDRRLVGLAFDSARARQSDDLRRKRAFAEAKAKAPRG